MMSDTKIFAMPDGGGNNMLAMLPALLQRQGVDPNLVALCQGRGQNGWGGDGIFGILLLFILMGAFNGNGFGFGGGGNRGCWGGNGQGGVVPMLNNDANTAVIMQAVQRNGFDISSLATALNTSSDAVMAAINALGGQICNLGTQMGQNTNQLLTAIMQGNNGIISQLCSCCCDIKQLIAQFGADNRLAMCQQTNTIQNGINGVNIGVERGFSSLGYALAEQGCQSRQNADANTRAILAKIDAIEDSRKDRELAEKDRQIATLTARSERQAELAPIYQQLSEIACNQPPVKKICCPEQYVPVNTGINAMYGLIPTGCGNVFAGAFNSFGNGTGSFF